MDGAIRDVLVGGLGDKAGFGPGMAIVAMNSRRYSNDWLHEVLKQSVASKTPIEFIVENTGYFKVLKIDYHGRGAISLAEREAGTPDLLEEILQPLDKKDRKEIKAIEKAAADK